MENIYRDTEILTNEFIQHQPIGRDKVIEDCFRQMCANLVHSLPYDDLKQMFGCDVHDETWAKSIIKTMGSKLYVRNSKTEALVHKVLSEKITHLEIYRRIK